ncbi:MAG: hydroxymethylbilane synthase [Bacteroidota bacterium]
MTTNRLIVGTRGSELALWQSKFIQSQLVQRYPDLTIELQPIKTLGDKILDSPLSKIGDKGLFTKEIEHALLDARIDLAVHSLKDIPTNLPAGLAIGAVLEREDTRDVFIAHPRKPGQSFLSLPKGSKVATGSLRRKCQLLSRRPDLHIVDIRGNLNTRTTKLEESDWAGMILAFAGVKRLGWEATIAEILPFDVMLPAVGQGALALEIRADDRTISDLLKPLHHDATAFAVLGERAFLRELEGGCQVPIGTHGRIENGLFVLDALIGSLDGKRVIRGKISGRPSDSEKLGISLAVELYGKGGREILEEIRAEGTETAAAES